MHYWSQTPDEGIGTLSGQCGTQEVFDDSHLSGNIEGSQTDVKVINTDQIIENSSGKSTVYSIKSSRLYGFFFVLSEMEMCGPQRMASSVL